MVFEDGHMNSFLNAWNPRLSTFFNENNSHHFNSTEQKRAMAASPPTEVFFTFWDFLPKFVPSSFVPVMLLFHRIYLYILVVASPGQFSQYHKFQYVRCSVMHRTWDAYPRKIGRGHIGQGHIVMASLMILWSLTIFPDVADEGVLAGLEVLDNVLVERVHVLHEPLGGAVVHLSRVMHDGEVGGALRKTHIVIKQSQCFFFPIHWIRIAIRALLCPNPEAEFLDEIQTKVFRLFLLAFQSHHYSFALGFLFIQTHATSYSFYSVLLYTVKEKGG